jgi:hypothetical protein
MVDREDVYFDARYQQMAIDIGENGATTVIYCIQVHAVYVFIAGFIK